MRNSDFIKQQSSVLWLDMISTNFLYLKLEHINYNSIMKGHTIIMWLTSHMKPKVLVNISTWNVTLLYTRLGKKHFVVQYESFPSSSGSPKALAFLLNVASSSSDDLSSWKSGRWSSSRRSQNAGLESGSGCLYVAQAEIFRLVMLRSTYLKISKLTTKNKSFPPSWIKLFQRVFSLKVRKSTSYYITC